MYDELIAELSAPWRADFALQPKTPSERHDVIYIQKLRKGAAEAIERLTARVAELEADLARMTAYADKRNITALDADSQLIALRKQEPAAYVTDSGRSAVMVAGANLDDDTPLYAKAPPAPDDVK